MARSKSASPVLADVANVLSGQMRNQLRRFAVRLRPHVDTLDSRFLARLQELQFGPKQRRALAALTAGAAARIVARRRQLHVFLEQVEYNGGRLAKLNLPPTDIVEALVEYDRLLTPMVEELFPGESDNVKWVREQLQFCVILTLNRTYYQVRETEAAAFYELFRTELEARTLDELVRGSLEVLFHFCGAQAGRFYLLEEETGKWVAKATLGAAPGGASRNGGPHSVALSAQRRKQLSRPRSIRTSGRSRQVLLDERWEKRFASVWSVPLITGSRLTGVMQFGFSKFYDWLPREQELLQAAAERCQVAAEKARLVEDLAAREEQVRRLAEHMLHIEEVERRRISRELHDEAGQSLLCIRLQLEMLEKESPDKLGDWRDRVAGIREITENTIIETRRLIAALSPAVLEQLGLAAALRQLANRFRQYHRCRMRLQLNHLEGLPKRMETIVYRLIQECCNNAGKHSQASTVNISVSSADGILRLYVEDDGVGFPVAETLKRRNTFGLAGMRERVTLLGGIFQIQSEMAQNGSGGGRRPRSGTRITAELPIPQHG